MAYFANGDMLAPFPPEIVGRIDFSGQNEASIGDGSHGHAVQLRLSEGARVRIGSRCNLGAVDLFSVGGSIEIGDDVSINGVVSIYNHEGRDIRIGDGCLFANGAVVTTSDMHSIVDAANGDRLNAPRDVTIGNRVWIGFNCFVLKGATIADGSVVGAASVVTASLKIPPNSMVAGNPARVVKSAVTWSLDLLPLPERRWHRLWR